MATQIGTVIDGKYEILKQIGKGGMSTVYLAMDKRLNKQWAVKEISRKGFGKNNEEIVNEVPADAEMMKALDHPAIPTIVDIIDHRDNEFIYVVMDYVEGESLDKVLAEYGAQPQDMVIDWAKQICDAFSYGGFADSEMATHFYNICNFYKSDVGNSVESRDYASEYELVFDSINKCIEYLDTYKESNANFVKAAMYKSTIDFIHTNIYDIAKYSETDETTLISLLDTIEQKANDINEIENEKSRAYQAKKYVLDKVPEYKQQVENQYKNLSR